MFDNFQPSYIIAVTAVISSIAILGYFSWKTLITSNVFQKGVNLYKQENYKDAEAAFRQMISLNSTNDVVHLLLGDTLMQQGKLEEAIQQFQEVINRAPKKVDAYLRLSNAFMRQEKKAEAISNLEKARDLCQAQRQQEKAEQINRILQKISKNNS
ncbi:tetratricopeptide repeat protein [Scytonema sp. PCC 10023]|uniref:tetratricopeptide repeat protein n=1 Tax=Scytonema sp. PCC 10023 TaxID=1680591 RepID=UPI0039C5FE47